MGGFPDRRAGRHPAQNTLRRGKDRLVEALAALSYALSPQLPRVRSFDETLDRLLAGNDSLARFGDGELALLRGRDIGFQSYDPQLAAALAAMLRFDQEGLLIALPDVFEPSRLQVYDREARRFWKRNLLFTRRLYRAYCDQGKVYENAFLSRPYLLYGESLSREALAARFQRLKLLWAGRDIAVVEGYGSRLGVGNDLFAGARSVGRILCPAQNAYARYGEILAAASGLGRETLLLLALGPTAKLLARDLSRRGARALDIGHLDIEYEWFLMGAQEKCPVPGKYVNEVGATELPALRDPVYESQILFRI